MNFVQIVTTTRSKEEAEKIAQEVVEKRVAGCVQVFGPVTSTYWWKEKIEKAEEWICLIKSRIDLYEELESAIRSVHSYEVPEIIVLPIEAGYPSYLKWLDNELKRIK